MPTDSRTLAIWILCSFAIFGFLEYFAEEIWIAHAFLLALLSFAWCRAHAEESDIPEPTGSALMVALFSFVGAVIYLFRSQKPGSALRASVLVVLFTVLCIVAYAVPYLLLNLLLA